MNEIGVLSIFSGIAVHDGLAAYSGYEQCQDVLCNTHLLRDLQGIYEQTAEKWAKDIKELLVDAKQVTEQHEG